MESSNRCRILWAIFSCTKFLTTDYQGQVVPYHDGSEEGSSTPNDEAEAVEEDDAANREGYLEAPSQELPHHQPNWGEVHHLQLQEALQVPPQPFATHGGERDRVIQTLSRMEGIVGLTVGEQEVMGTRIQQLAKETSDAYGNLKAQVDQIGVALHQWHDWAQPFGENCNSRITAVENCLSDLLAKLNAWQSRVEEREQEQGSLVETLHAKIMGALTLLENERKLRVEQGLNFQQEILRLQVDMEKLRTSNSKEVLRARKLLPRQQKKCGLG